MLSCMPEATHVLFHLAVICDSFRCRAYGTFCYGISLNAIIIPGTRASSSRRVQPVFMGATSSCHQGWELLYPWVLSGVCIPSTVCMLYRLVALMMCTPLHLDSTLWIVLPSWMEAGRRHQHQNSGIAHNPFVCGACC